MNGKLTRRAVLVECYSIFEATARRFSWNETLLGPKEGYDVPFELEKQKMAIMRDFIQELDASEAKGGPADAKAAHA